MASLDASYYDCSEVSKNDNFQIQLPNMKKAIPGEVSISESSQ